MAVAFPAGCLPFFAGEKQYFLYTSQHEYITADVSLKISLLQNKERFGILYLCENNNISVTLLSKLLVVTQRESRNSQQFFRREACWVINTAIMLIP